MDAPFIIMPSVTQYANNYLQGAINLLDDTSFLFPFGGALSLNGLWNEISGKASQQREFEQAEYMQDKENMYNDPSAQMERMIAAGINPNTAAAGIAGSPNLSAQPPSVASSDPAAGLSAVGSAASALAGVPLSGAEAMQAKANARLLNANANNVDQSILNQTLDTASRLIPALMAGGLPEIGASLMGLNIANGGIDTVLQYMQAYDGARQFDVQYRSLVAARDKAIAEADNWREKLAADISLAEETARSQNASAQKQQADADYQTGLNALYEQYPFMRLPGAMQFVYLGNEKGFDSPEYKGLGKAISDGEYFRNKGRVSAEVEKSYELAYNRALGVEEAHAEYAGFAAYVENNKALVQTMIESFIGHSNGANPLNAVIDALKVLFIASYEDITEESVIPPVAKPNPTPKK